MPASKNCVFFGECNFCFKCVLNFAAAKFLSFVLNQILFRSLVPVTQLYVSVDASTQDSLKKIDRPLFKDFWPRFLDSLKALGEKVSFHPGS